MVVPVPKWEEKVDVKVVSVTKEEEVVEKVVFAVKKMSVSVTKEEEKNVETGASL